MNRIVTAALIAMLVLAGCAGKGERVNIAIPGGAVGPDTLSERGTALRVIVRAFDDARSDRSHLGSLSNFWGGSAYFELSEGTVGDAVAKTLVQELRKRGWEASLAGRSGSSKPDATISGSIRDLSVVAIGKFARTEITATNTMALRVENHRDESTIREQVLASGSDEVFWVEPKDVEQLANEVILKNIEKFLADTKVEGRTVKLR